MNKNKEIIKNEITEDEASKISGGAVFEVKCSCCGKKINYADHRWGNETDGSASFCKGYMCDECVEKFRGGEIKDEKQLEMFNQLDTRGDSERYKPYI